MKRVYRYTWLNGCVTFAEDYSAEDFALLESTFGKLVRKEEAL